jgi:hypothetical protein
MKKKMHHWYFLQMAIYGLIHIEATTPIEIFKLPKGFKLHVGFEASYYLPCVLQRRTHYTLHVGF